MLYHFCNKNKLGGGSPLPGHSPQFCLHCFYFCVLCCLKGATLCIRGAANVQTYRKMCGQLSMARFRDQVHKAETKLQLRGVIAQKKINREHKTPRSLAKNILSTRLFLFLFLLKNKNKPTKVLSIKNFSPPYDLSMFFWPNFIPPLYQYLETGGIA